MPRKELSLCCRSHKKVRPTSNSLGLPALHRNQRRTNRPNKARPTRRRHMNQSTKKESNETKTKGTSANKRKHTEDTGIWARKTRRESLSFASALHHCCRPPQSTEQPAISDTSITLHSWPNEEKLAEKNTAGDKTTKPLPHHSIHASKKSPHDRVAWVVVISIKLYPTTRSHASELHDELPCN